MRHSTSAWRGLPSGSQPRFGIRHALLAVEILRSACAKADRVRLVDYPRLVDRAAYDNAIAEAVSEWRRDPAVAAIYRFGAVAAPGISDLDLLVVVEDEREVVLDPLGRLSATSRYLFTHAPFAVTKKLFRRAVEMFPSDRLDLLWSTNGTMIEAAAGSAIAGVIARQTALEYLLANYIIRAVEARYGIVSVRSVLLSSYALRHDLALLGEPRAPIALLVQQLGEWRAQWFQQRVTREQIVDWVTRFVSALGAFLQDALQRHPVAVPDDHCGKYARHIRVVVGNRLDIRHRGLVLPPRLGALGRRFVRAQHRLNRFRVTIPATLSSPGSALDARFRLYRELSAERRRWYPQFGALSTPWINLV